MLLAIASVFPRGRAEAKTFRHYYGMQWEWEPVAVSGQPTLGKKGDVLFKTKLLPTKLFVLEDDFVVAGKLILPKGEQLAQAESRFIVRCSLGPAARPSLADDRRICFWDSDGDKVLDAWFDEGMGMEWAKFQFTGCLPLVPLKETVPAMSAADPAQTKWPFFGTLTLGSIKARTDKQTGQVTYGYRLDFEIKRSDKPALMFSVCSSYGNCVVPSGMPVTLRGFLNFQVKTVDNDSVAFELLEPVARKGYFDMTPAGRPDPLYCPGSLFVKTDQHDVW